MATSMNQFITGVVVVGVVLVMAIFIAGSIQDATYEDNTVATVTNETGSWLNETTYTVDSSTATNFAGLTILSAINTTDNSSIGVGNFSVSGSGFTNATATTWDSIWVTYSYSYSADTAASNASSDLVTSLSNGSGWLTILIVVGFATIVLGMLTSGLGRSARVESSLAY